MSAGENKKKTDAQKKKAAEKKKATEAKKKRLADLEKQKRKKEAEAKKKETAQTPDKKAPEKIAASGQPGQTDSSKRKKETEEQRSARLLAEQRGVAPYDQASGPPDISQNIKKSIPVGPIEIKDLTPPAQKKTTPATGSDKKPQIDSRKKPLENQPVKKTEQRPPERRRLTPEQIKRRQEIFQPADGVGCAFDQVPTDQEVDRYMGERSKTDLWRLAYSNYEIVVTAFCSSPGEEGYNKKLAQKRANAVIDRMVNKYGISRERFTVKLVGDQASDQSSPDVDRPEDRVVMVDILDEVKNPVRGPSQMDVQAVHSARDLPNNHPEKQRLLEGRHPKDRSFPVGDDRLGLDNEETGRTVLIKYEDIPEGHSKINNTWVYRKGRELETRVFLPTTPSTVRKQLTKQLQDSRSRSLFPVTDVSDGAVRRRISMNMKLNNEIESFLKPGTSLKSALQKSRQAGVDRLRQSIGDVATQAIYEKFILGTLGEHNF